MRRAILIAAAIIMAAGTASAQRYLPGQRGIELSGGFVNGLKVKNSDGLGFYGNVGMSTYNKKGNRWVFGAEYLQREYAYRNTWFPVVQVTAEGGHYVKVLSDPAKIVFFSVGGSALLGYETLNWGERTMFDGAILTGKDGFIYGGAVNFEVETYLADRIVLLLRARERVMFGTEIGHFHLQFGAGIKFMIR